MKDEKKILELQHPIANNANLLATIAARAGINISVSKKGKK